MLALQPHWKLCAEKSAKFNKNQRKSMKINENRMKIFENQ